jgi:hypothetical protein
MVARFGSPPTPRSRDIAVALVLAAGLGLAVPAAAQVDTSTSLDVSDHQTRTRNARIDNWFTYQDNFDASGGFAYRLKLFIPFRIRNGWTFTQRFDVIYNVTNKKGSADPSGVWQGHIGDLDAEEIFDTPKLGNNFRAWGSVRVVAPTGGAAPFGNDQWQVAAALGTTRRATRLLAGLALSPYARYSWGFAPQDSGVTLVRKLNLLPTIGYDLVERISITLYPEQGILYNDNTGKWFVPIEAMVMYRGKHKGQFGLGGAYGLVTDYKVYQWLVEARGAVDF